MASLGSFKLEFECVSPCLGLSLCFLILRVNQQDNLYMCWLKEALLIHSCVYVSNLIESHWLKMIRFGIRVKGQGSGYLSGVKCSFKN